ncbi:MAG: tetratricopeptide repeat protein [Candidatus Eisenbacteria bacterium]|nr:tetratricopeptide repeat protein [Candidatus Eisenbacteria bacterium]
MRHRSRGCLAVLAVVLLPLCASAESMGAGERCEDLQAIRWVADLETALEQAEVEDKVVLANFYTGWCGWCRKMERETYRDPAVVKRSCRMVAVSVDGEKRADLARKLGATAFPTVVFLRWDGSPIQAVRGYKAPSDFALLLDRLLDAGAEEYTLRQRAKDHPELIEVRIDLARILLRRGAHEEACALLEETTEAGADLGEDRAGDLLLLRGRALMGAGRSGEARPLFAALAKMSRGRMRGIALYHLAESCLADGDRKEARKQFRRILETLPEGWLAARSRERLAELG